MPLLQQESKEQSRMPIGGGKPPTDSEAVNLRKCLFVGSTECPNRTLCARVSPIPFTPKAKWATVRCWMTQRARTASAPLSAVARRRSGVAVSARRADPSKVRLNNGPCA